MVFRGYNVLNLGVGFWFRCAPGSDGFFCLVTGCVVVLNGFGFTGSGICAGDEVGQGTALGFLNNDQGGKDVEAQACQENDPAEHGDEAGAET